MKSAARETSRAKPTPRTPRRDTLTLRVPPAERNLIDRAAAASGKTRTDFILQAARRAAEDSLLDRAFVSVAPGAYALFLAALDAPPQPNDRLRTTMQQPMPWR